MSAAPLVGSWTWARSGGGRLTRSDRRALLVQAMRVRLARLPRRLAHTLGLAAAVERIDLERVPIPDTRAARSAEAHCGACSGSALFHHCGRTYLWAALLGERDRIRVDHELLYVASMLHDLGLAETHRHAPGRAPCFAVHGARSAYDFLESAGWSAARAQAAAEAISLHLDIRVPLSQGAEAHLLHAGASLDVIGARSRELPESTLRKVIARHPGDGCIAAITAVMLEEARNYPDTRAAFLCEYGLPAMTRGSPLARCANR